MEITILRDFEGFNTPIAYMTRGHVDLKEFSESLERDYDVRPKEWQARHTYYRNIPLGKGCYTCAETAEGRGAYPVTICEEWNDLREEAETK